MKETLSIHHTNLLRGIAALGIFIFHILLGLDISPVFNWCGGMLVALFLILSGYGLNESYHKGGLNQYWNRRWHKVLLPFVCFAFAYNFLQTQGDIQNAVCELLYLKPTFWFIFHLFKCYLVYWIARRWMGQRWAIPFMVLCALIQLNCQTVALHLEAEQSFSFIAGVLLSEKKDEVFKWNRQRILRYGIFLIVIGLVCYIVKAIPAVQAYRGTLLFHYLLMPFRLSWGLAALLFSAWMVNRLPHHIDAWLQSAGRYSLEIYISHIPFLSLIGSDGNLSLFLLYSALSMAFLVLLRLWILPRTTLSAIIFVVVNCLFVQKYAQRVIPHAEFITFAFGLLLWLCVTYIYPCLLRHRRWMLAIGAVGVMLVLVMLVVQCLIDPYTLQVDRWSALHFPIKNMLEGVYPYIAETHLGGNASPFPVWQIVHIPFYLVGNVGLSFFFALAFLLYVIYRHHGLSLCIGALFFICISPAVWYEALVRSDMLTNVFVLAGIIDWSLAYLNREWVGRHWLAIALVVALLACTRLSCLVPIGLLLLPIYFKLGIRQQVLFPIAFLTFFALTFVPFALWDWQEFFYHENNPWQLQTRQGDWLDFIVYIPVGLYLALLYGTDYTRYYRNACVMMIVLVVVSFFHRMLSTGEWDLFASAYDITYLNAALPFAILYFIRNSISQLKKYERF